MSVYIDQSMGELRLWFQRGSVNSKGKCRISKKKVLKHGGLHLPTQLAGGRGRRINTSKPDWTTWDFDLKQLMKKIAESMNNLDNMKLKFLMGKREI